VVDIVPPLRTETLFDEFGNLTIRYAEYLEGVAVAIDESASDIDLFSSISNSGSSVSQLTKRINDLELLLDLSIDGKLSKFQKDFKVLEITANYTTSGQEIIICNNTTAITVTMRSSPNDKEEVHIIRKSGPVNFISSDGVNGSTTAIPILSQNDAPHLIYTSIASEWSII
jgi:hypothetical protein